MQIVSNILLFIVGMLIGWLFFQAVIIRVLYMLPKSIYMVSKGIIKPLSIFIILIVPVVFTAVLVTVGYFFPSILDYMDEHKYIGLSTNIYTLWLCFKYGITQNGRQKAKANFWLAVLSYMTNKGWAYVNAQREKEKEELEEEEEEVEVEVEEEDDVEEEGDEDNDNE